jgi:squalene cyclase
MSDQYGRLASKSDRVAAATLQLTRWSAVEAETEPPPAGLIRTVALASGAGMSAAEIAVCIGTSSAQVASILQRKVPQI